MPTLDSLNAVEYDAIKLLETWSEAPSTLLDKYPDDCSPEEFLQVMDYFKRLSTHLPPNTKLGDALKNAEKIVSDIIRRP
jgi:hypothetical protein